MQSISQSKRPAARRRGHPAKIPSTRLGKYILTVIEAAGATYCSVWRYLGVSRATFYRWLNGTTQATRRITIEGIADALALAGEPRQRFMETCAGYLAHPTHPTPLHITPSVDDGKATTTASPNRSGGKGGRSAQSAPTPFGVFLQETLSETRISQRELARQLHVSPATITYLIHSVERRTYKLTAESVADALGLTGMKRRVFLGRAAQAGVFALSGAFEAPRLFLLHHPRFELDEMKQRLDTLKYLQDQGKTLQIAQEVREMYHSLTHAPLRETDPASVLLKVQAASLLANVQEATIPWYRRAARVIATYTRLENEVLNYFPVARFAASRAYVAGRKAPLYREAGDLEEGRRWFTYGLQHYIPYADAPILQVELYRNRAHIYAVEGNEKEWRNDLERARAVARGLASPTRESLLDQITYSEGEGLKRLIVASESPVYRERYARLALDTLRRSLRPSLTVFYPAMGAHRLLVGVSEAQCLVWLNPDEAITQAEHLRPQVKQIYPAMIQKIDRVVAAARQRRGDNDTATTTLALGNTLR